MRKLAFLFLLSSLFLFNSCNINDNNTDRITDNDTFSVVYEITKSFQYDNNERVWLISGNFNRDIPASDVILVYKYVKTQSGRNVWEQLPVVYHSREYLYIPDGKQLKYSFEFSTAQVNIIAGGDFDLAGQSAQFNDGYLNNQRFRIVVVPASMGNSSKNSVDYSNYNEVIRYFNIDDSKVKNLK